MIAKEIISQGAEATIYKTHFLGEIAIVKERLPKRYRHPKLDQKITNERHTNEAKIMVKARKLGINIPYIMEVDTEIKTITMQFVDGLKLKDFLNQNHEVEINQLLRDVGKNISILHNNGIIHGDLTTSNFLIKKSDQGTPIIYMIDFGLSYIKNNIEDFAVDLYVLEKAFISTHPDLETQFEFILVGYQAQAIKGKETLQHLEAVRQRGRKKIAFG